MAGQTIDNLRVQFGADFRELLAEMRKAEAATAKFRGTVQKELTQANDAFARLGSQARSALLGLAGAFGLARISTFARDTLRWADDMKTLADRLGISVESLQELQHAGREVNITVQEMGAGLQRFAIALAEASAGKGRGVEAFKAMGINLRDARGELKSFDTVLEEFADKIKQFDRPSQLALAKTFFGDEGALKFLDLVGKGSDAIRRLREEGRSTGVVLKNELFDQGEKLNKEVERLETKIGVDLKKAVLDFAPAWKVALEAVVEVQLAVDRLLSSIRIGGNRLGKPVTPAERRAEIERDLAEAERKLDDAQKRKPGLFGPIRGPGEQQALQQDVARLKRELEEQKKIAPLLPEQEAALKAAQDAARRRAEREAAPEGGTRTVDLSDKGTAQAETFAKLMVDLRTKTEQAQAALDPYRAAIADLDGKLKKMTASDKQAAQAREEFNKAWNALGVKALTEFGAESEHLAKVAAAEAAGRRDLVAVLELEWALRQKFGESFVRDNQAQIEALAKARLATEQLRERQRALQQDLEGMFDSFTGHATEAFDSILNRSKTVGEAMRDFWLSVLRDIANEALKLALINPFKNWAFGQNNPTMDDLWLRLLGSAVSGAAGGFSGGDIIGGVGGATIPIMDSGGSVSAGTPTLIGRGAQPELFVPNTDGMMYPRGSYGGAVTYIDARGADQAAVARLEAIVRAQGQDFRRYQATERERVVGHVAMEKRRSATVFG